MFGDEHYARYEDMNGYSAVYDDELGLFCYARLRRAASARPASALAAAPAGLVRHLQESQADDRRSRRSAEAAPLRDDRRWRDDEAVVRTFGPNQGLLEGRVLSIGAVKGLTILVNFQDLASTVTTADVDDDAERRQLHAQRQYLLGDASISSASPAASSTTRMSWSALSS